MCALRFNRPRKVFTGNKTVDKFVIVEHQKPKKDVRRKTHSEPLFSTENLSKPPTPVPTLAEDERLVKLKRLRRCQNEQCLWPRERSNLDRLDSSQQIQLRWIEDNLMADFEKNVIEIQERAFNHGLWRIFLSCLAARNQLDEYVTCCMALDDIRLIDIDQFIDKGLEDDIIGSILSRMERKQILLRSKRDSSQHSNICLKCESVQESLDGLRDELMPVTEVDRILPAESEDDLSFNLMNLLELVMMKRSSTLRLVIKKLEIHPQLLSLSKIPASFYLRAINLSLNKNDS